MRKFLKKAAALLLALSFGICGTACVDTSGETGNGGDSDMKKIQVGAIRWDAWYGGEKGVDTDPGYIVEQTLGSSTDYHYRLPFFSTINYDENGQYTGVSIRGNSQEVMDQEINYAVEGGIDYWAFLVYSGEMSYGRTLYKSSTIANKPKFCYIFDTNFLNSYITGQEEMSLEILQDLGNEYYQKTSDGRPVIYIFDANLDMISKIEKFSAAAKEMYQKKPYFIGMTFEAGKIQNILTEMNCDAVSSYGFSATHGAEYSVLAETDSDNWDNMSYYCEVYGGEYIPTITTGFDKRPRSVSVGYPTMWEQDDAVGTSSYDQFKDYWTQQGTPEEIAEHLGDGVDYARELDNSLFASVLVYAWNENDEGGWLVPTLEEITKYNKPLRLDAIREVLEEKGNI